MEANPTRVPRHCLLIGVPDVDLFASRLNHQCPMYYAWKPDPREADIDAIVEDWCEPFFYAFTQLNLVGRVFKKVESNRVTDIAIVPYWSTQSWFTSFANVSVNDLFTTPMADGPTQH